MGQQFELLGRCVSETRGCAVRAEREDGVEAYQQGAAGLGQGPTGKLQRRAGHGRPVPLAGKCSGERGRERVKTQFKQVMR